VGFSVPVVADPLTKSGWVIHLTHSIGLGVWVEVVAQPLRLSKTAINNTLNFILFEGDNASSLRLHEEDVLVSSAHTEVDCMLDLHVPFGLRVVDFSHRDGGPSG